MALRRALIKDRQIRNRKPVACAGIGLDHMVHSGVRQSLFEANFLLLRKTRVFDRAGDIHPSGDMFHKAMRTVGFIGSQMAAVKRRDRCEAIAWSADGYRMGFLVNGYELRVFDAEPRKQVAQVKLAEPGGTPSTRIARGITFSPNGAAVTFDDCPRFTSGCKSGLVGIR